MPEKKEAEDWIIKKEEFLKLIPDDGVSIRDLYKKLGIFILEDRIIASKVLRDLQKLEKERLIQEVNGRYYPFDVAKKFSQWFDNFLEDAEFRENLSKLGEFEYYDEEMDEPLIFKYWTDTRWKITEIVGKKYILTPAFWNDEEIEARFALICNPKFNLMVYVKKDNEEKIIGRIGCFKILRDYSADLKPIGIKRIELSPKDELLATIQNLDQFFTEEKPYFVSLDYNIVYQALKIIIEKGLASRKLLDLRCNEIKEIILELIKEDKKHPEINSQIYIQLKALLDFEPNKWIPDLIDKFDINKYLNKMLEIEGIQIKKGAMKALAIINTVKTIGSDIPDLESLIQSLKVEDSTVRLIALKLLEEIVDERAVDSLIQTLKSEYLSVRRGAVRLLGKIKDVRAITPLIQMLFDSDETTQILIMKVLRMIGKPAIKPLIQALKNQYLMIPDQIFKTYKKIGEKAVEPIIQVLEEVNREVQIMLTESLEDFDEIRNVDSLIRLIRTLKNKKDYIRIKLIGSLKKIEIKKAVNALIQTLRDEDVSVRHSAIWAIGIIDDPRVIKPLTQILESESNDIIKKDIKSTLMELRKTWKNYF